MHSENSEHGETAKELSEYSKYLVKNQKDHFGQAVLRFDEDFRTHDAGEGLAFNNLALVKLLPLAIFML